MSSKIILRIFYVSLVSLFCLLNFQVGYMEPDECGKVLSSSQDTNVVAQHFITYKWFYRILGGALLSSSLCYIFFFRGGKGGGGDLPNATDFRAVHWGSDSMSEAGSEASSQAISEAVSEAVGEILADAAAPAIAGAGAAAIAGAGAAIAGNIVVDPALAASFSSCIDLYAYAALDPAGYTSLIELESASSSAYALYETSKEEYVQAVMEGSPSLNAREADMDRLIIRTDRLSISFRMAIRSAMEALRVAQA